MVEKNSASRPEEEAQDLSLIISSNIKRLISQTGITQKELAEKLGVAAASMTEYCKGRRIPNVEFFVSLKNHFDISIDDFLTKKINPTAPSLPAKTAFLDSGTIATYHKYCGLYLAFYLDTGKYKGKDSLSPQESLVFGLLYLYENPTSLTIPEFSCAAILGIKSLDEALQIKGRMEELEEPSKIMDYIGRQHSETAYYGDFELSQDHAFISLRHVNTDRALIILHRVDNNKTNYAGGIGTINSISKGRERTPVVQFMGLSRYPLSLSIEEIHRALLLDSPSYDVGKEADDLTATFKLLYLDSPGEKERPDFTDHQKSLIIRATLERSIRKNMERNMFRYAKISERDDDEWYHAVKRSSKANVQASKNQGSNL